MSIVMKQDYKFVDVSGGAYIELVDVTRTIVVSDYQPTTEEKQKMSMIQPSPIF